MRKHKFYFLSSMLIVLAGAALVFGQGIKSRKQAEVAPAEETGRDRARDLYYLADKTGEIRYTGLRVKLYQADEQCNFYQVSPYKTFRSGEAIRFAVESNTSGYLYIAQRGSSGKSTLLFPHPEINGGANQMRRGAELMIPGRNWIRFDNTPGVETLTIIFTRRKLDLLPYLIQPAGTTEPAATPSAGQNAGVEAAVLDILQGRSKSRDLVYTPEDAPAPVVATSGAFYHGLYAVNMTQSNNEYCVLQLKLKHQ
jgi:hypothetical protein